MNKITPLTPSFAVTGALALADFALIRAMGFKAVVSNLPDGEHPSYPTALQAAAAAAEAGLAFRHIPTTKFDVFSERVVGGMQAALSECEGPVLAHCASGLRSAAAWAGAAAWYQDADCVLHALLTGGFDMSPLRDELQAQHGETHAGPIPAALDAGFKG